MSTAKVLRLEERQARANERCAISGEPIKNGAGFRLPEFDGQKVSLAVCPSISRYEKVGISGLVEQFVHKICFDRNCETAKLDLETSEALSDRRLEPNELERIMERIDSIRSVLERMAGMGLLHADLSGFIGVTEHAAVFCDNGANCEFLMDGDGNRDVEACAVCSGGKAIKRELYETIVAFQAEAKKGGDRG